MRTTLLFLVGVLMVIQVQAQITSGNPFQANSYTSSDQYEARVAYGGQGSSVVVWTSDGQDEASNTGVYGQRYDANGMPAGSEFLINTTTADYQEHPDVAMDANGNFVVTWTSNNQDGDAQGVYMQRFDANGNKVGNEIPVNLTFAYAQSRSKISMNAAGWFAITWVTFDPSNWDDVRARVFDANGVAQTNEIHVNQTTLDRQSNMDIAMDDNGNFVVVWNSDHLDNDGLAIAARHFDASGTPLGNEFQVNTYTTQDQYAPAVDMGNNGNFIIGWVSTDQDGSNAGVYAQPFDNTGTPVGTEIHVNNNYTFDAQTDVDVAMSPNGNFAVTWKSWLQDGDNYGVMAKRFLASGAHIGNSFQVNSYVSAEQEDPAIAFASDGSFMVAWESMAEDGDGDGVFVQRYIEGVLSVEPPHLQEALTLFPNPANEYTTLSISDQVSGKITMQLLTVTGQLISEQTVQHTGNQQYLFDLLHVAPGMYTLRVVHDRALTAFPFVKQ